MIAAFIIWSAAAAAFIAIGAAAGASEKPAGFWANAKAPEIRDVKAYNRAVSRLWYIFAVLFELMGLPLLLCEQNSPLVLLTILGTVALCLGIMIAYTLLEQKYRK